MSCQSLTQFQIAFMELVHGLWVHLDVPLASFVRYDRIYVHAVTLLVGVE